MTGPDPVLAFLGHLTVYAVMGLGIGLSLVVGVRTVRDFHAFDVIARWRDECRAARAKQEASDER